MPNGMRYFAEMKNFRVANCITVVSYPFRIERVDKSVCGPQGHLNMLGPERPYGTRQLREHCCGDSLTPFSQVRIDSLFLNICHGSSNLTASCFVH